jgi:hypothetical protein
MGYVFNRANLAAANNNRRASPNIWGDCPWNDIGFTKGGVKFFDDFDTIGFTVPTTEGQIGPYYKAFSSTGGVIKPAAATRGGVVTLGSDGDDEGAAIATVCPPFKITANEGKLWFEARIKVDTIAVTKFDAFIGLGELMTLTATVPITATAGTLADQNLVGFLRPGTGTTGDGSILRATYKANTVTAVTVLDTASALAADTYVKVGMKFDPTDNYLRFFINNLELTSKKLIPDNTGVDFPADVMLGPIAAVTNAVGSITSVFTIDWWRVAQLDAGEPT